MSQPLQEYRSALREQLNCGGRVRKSLLRQFDQMAASLLLDNPSPSSSDLADALGSPRELAQKLMDEVPESIQTRHVRSHWLLRIIAVILVVMLIGYAAIMTFSASKPVTVTETITISEEIPV